jgi:hypothetical protein
MLRPKVEEARSGAWLPARDQGGESRRASARGRATLRRARAWRIVR